MKRFVTVLAVILLLAQIVSLAEDACEDLCPLCNLCRVAPCPEHSEPYCSCQSLYSDRSGFLLSTDGTYFFGSLPLVSESGKSLYNMLYLPAGEQTSYTTVLMLHGLNATADGMGIMARELVQHGYACLTFDFANGSNLSKSGSKMKKMSILTEKSDLLSVMDQLPLVDYLDLDNLFLYSESQGGMVTAASLPELHDAVSGLIMAYPALHIPEHIRAEYPDRDALPSTVKMAATSLGRIYAEAVYDMDAWALCAGFDGPVLLMHGTEDTSVKLSISQRASKTFSDAELIIIEGAGHGFSSASFRPLTMQYAADFIRLHEK